MLKRSILTLITLSMLTISSGCSTSQNAISTDAALSDTSAAPEITASEGSPSSASESERPIQSKDGSGNSGGRNGGNRNSAGGGIDGETDASVVALVAAESQKFTQETYTDSETGITLEYSLYVPDSYDENTEYPLLMYIPDSTAAGKSAKEIVEQYYGANVWVTDEDQEKHPSFVVVPAFSEVIVSDNNSTSDEIIAAVNLLNHLTEIYSIDTNRLYTTGQSMGCMTSLYLNSIYPDMFAASLLVSGQWDISVLEPLLTDKFFYITAGGDTKASNGQDEVISMFEDNGVSYTYDTWNAQNTEDIQNESVKKMLENGNNANMIRFETGTVLDGSSDMEHMASFKYGYKISAIRDWLFEQSK